MVLDTTDSTRESMAACGPLRTVASVRFVEGCHDGATLVPNASNQQQLSGIVGWSRQCERPLSATSNDPPAEPVAFAVAGPSKGPIRDRRSRALNITLHASLQASQVESAVSSRIHASSTQRPAATAANVKLLLPPRQSRGNSHVGLANLLSGVLEEALVSRLLG